jgi:hypothetical protein
MRACKISAAHYVSPHSCQQEVPKPTLAMRQNCMTWSLSINHKLKISTKHMVPYTKHKCFKFHDEWNHWHTFSKSKILYIYTLIKQFKQWMTDGNLYGTNQQNCYKIMQNTTLNTLWNLWSGMWLFTKAQISKTMQKKQIWTTQVPLSKNITSIMSHCQSYCDKSPPQWQLEMLEWPRNNHGMKPTVNSHDRNEGLQWQNFLHYTAAAQELG